MTYPKVKMFQQRELKDRVVLSGFSYYLYKLSRVLTNILQVWIVF